MKKMLVVDGNSIVNRAYYGVKPLTTSYGLHTNAVFGMINILDKHISTLSPDYCAIAFDLKAPTFRHEMYPEYKAGRRPMPPELAEQFPIAKDAAEALGFKRLELPGYEADDILGTLSEFADDNMTVYLLTGDRDSLQLIGQNVHVLLATNSDTIDFDIKAFYEKYSVLPSQYVDVKALMGDSSDNIPGVRGIGEKTAFSLISQFGSLDDLYEALPEAKLTPSVKNKLTDGRESAYMSRTLAQICRDVPLDITLDMLAYPGIDTAKAFNLFKKLEFSAFIKRYNLQKKVNSFESAAGSDATSEIKMYDKNDLSLLDKQGIVASVSLDTNEDLYIYDGDAVLKIESSDISALSGKLAAFLDGRNSIVCYDCKALYKQTDRYGVYFRSCFFDVMLAAYVINSGEGSYELSRLVIAYLGESANERIPAAVYIYDLYDVLRKRLSNDGLDSLMYDIEMPLSQVLTEMENTGFHISPSGIKEYGEVLSTLAKDYETRIYAEAGTDFNINSPKQLGDVLFNQLKIPYPKKSKGSYSTSAEILEKLRPFYPIVDDVLEYRKVTKLKSTYVDGLLREADQNGRVHTTFKQTGTATGRLSSTEPNLQNIPIRTELGRQMRRFFVPENENYLLIDADYSQIELRLLAHIAGDEAMIEAFKSGKDIHSSTAQTIFGVSESEVTLEMRKKAKAINFGILYGMGEFTLSNDLKISRAKAKEYIKNYLDGFPKVDAYLKDTIKFAYENGYVTTMYGRRRYIPELSGQNKTLRAFGERVAMNSPIQGSAADIIKIAMINVFRRLRDEKLDARLILQVHDELLIEASRQCAERAKKILCEEMESAAKLKVPLTVDVQIGDSWYYEK